MPLTSTKQRSEVRRPLGVETALQPFALVGLQPRRLRRPIGQIAFMADIVAKRLVRYLERAGYVVMKRPPVGGHSWIARGFEG
jgi:hypothetical protein